MGSRNAKQHRKHKQARKQGRQQGRVVESSLCLDAADMLGTLRAMVDEHTGAYEGEYSVMSLLFTQSTGAMSRTLVHGLANLPSDRAERHRFFRSIGEMVGRDSGGALLPCVFMTSEVWLRDPVTDEIAGEALMTSGMTADGETVMAMQHITRDTTDCIHLSEPTFASSAQGDAVAAPILDAFYDGVLAATRAA